MFAHDNKIVSMRRIQRKHFLESLLVGSGLQVIDPLTDSHGLFDDSPLTLEILQSVSGNLYFFLL